MTNCSNYKIHAPVVKLSTVERITSVAPHKLVLTTEKYYQNKIDHEWEQEYYNIYNPYMGEIKQ